MLSEANKQVSYGDYELLEDAKKRNSQLAKEFR